jgi:hypothetical protein
MVVKNNLHGWTLLTGIVSIASFTFLFMSELIMSAVCSEGSADCAKVKKPASLSDSLGIGDQVAPNGIHMSDEYDRQMDVDDLLGDVGDSSAESSGTEETKPRMVSAKLEDEWLSGTCESWGESR